MIKMPCEAGPSPEDIKKQKEERNILTRLACMMCKTLETRGEPIPEWAWEWWRNHQEADRRRLQLEKAEEMEKQLRADGWNALSPEQRKALGLTSDKVFGSDVDLSGYISNFSLPDMEIEFEPLAPESPSKPRNVGFFRHDVD